MQTTEINLLIFYLEKRDPGSALSAKELEKEILSILAVMDKRLQDVAIYQEEDFREHSFFPYGIFPHPWKQTAECCIFLPDFWKHREI